MTISWESSIDSAAAKARETGRLVMAEFHSPH
jgi:hypothetical protein